MASTDKELEQQLMEAGNKLLTPPPSVDELLPLLDQVESCLSRVEQSPTKSMQNALAPSLQALVVDQLFRHSDIDVKVAVASCFSEITRITAPDAPYNDDQMKDVFQLIVSSFENLADKSSRSYGKRTSILETVAKVRSCVVMLDLECDALIIEMFLHFLKAIRDYHPENVFSSMETIMTLVLEESEDISIELLSPLLDSVKKTNEEVLPVARKLGEKVLESCATKIKPYLIHAVKSLSISLDDYSEVVASICQEIPGDAELNDAPAADENKVEGSKPVEVSLDEAAQADKLQPEAASPKQAGPSNEKSPNSIMSNGVTQNRDDCLADSTSLKKLEDDPHTDQSKSIDSSNNAEPDILDAEQLVSTESKLDQPAKKRGKKVYSSIKLSEPSESSHIVNEKKPEELSNDESHGKDGPSSPPQDPSVEVAVPSENQKEISSQPSSPKALESEPMTVVSSSVSDESLPVKVGRSNKIGLVKDSVPSAKIVSRKTSEGTSDSEAKPQKSSGRKAPDGASEDKTQMTIDVSKKTNAITESDAKPLKLSSKRVDVSSNDGDGLPIKQLEDKKRHSRGKAMTEKNVAKSSTKHDTKEKLLSHKSATKSPTDVEETPTTNTKRKRGPAKEKTSDNKEDGNHLVGSRIKVWWPMDRQFYKGIIDSFDAVKMKHKVIYDDGEIEVLNLKKQTWKVIGSGPEQDEEEAAGHLSPDSSSDMPLKKRVKTNPDQSIKHGKTDASPKSGRGASSSKFRNAATKSGRRSKEIGKADSNPADDSKPAKKTEDHSGGKTRDHTPKSAGKSADIVSKTVSKSKSEDVTSKKSKEGRTSTPKGSRSKQETPKEGKSKPETPKINLSVKGKPPKSGGKSNVNGTGKLKSGSSRVKEVEDKEESPDSDELRESTKRKSSHSSKGQGSEMKSGKKPRRA